MGNFKERKIKKQTVNLQTAEKSFLAQLNNFRNEARTVAYYGYADMAIRHAASKSKRLLLRLNDSPTFWNTAHSAFQTSTYITLGRIFDSDGKYNIKLLLDSAESGIALFQRDALAQRKREGHTSNPDWLDEYLDNAYYPTEQDFAHLRIKVEKARKLYSDTMKPVRDKHIAHRVARDYEEVVALFSRGKAKDLWRLIVFVQQLEEVLWHLFHNGRKPHFRPMRYSVASMFKSPPSGSSSIQYIVRETQKLMEFIENATPPS